MTARRTQPRGGARRVDLIFMLTRNDRTVADCLEVFEAVRPMGLRHVGFKDVGVDAGTLAALNVRIRQSGAMSWMEVVSTDPARALASARTGAALGVDWLLGGTDVNGVLPLLAGTHTKYLPFPGRPIGHPTRLGGDASLVEEQCRRFMAAGCAGADLLAYRATEADPLDLVTAARRGLGQDGFLVVAGSIATAAQIHALARAGANAFTVGSAAFDGSYVPHKGALASQLAAILADCGQACSA